MEKLSLKKFEKLKLGILSEIIGGGEPAWRNTTYTDKDGWTGCDRYLDADGSGKRDNGECLEIVNCVE